MKKITLLLLLLSSVYAIGQEDAWVYFTDKPDAAHYLANPLEMLSQRALDRRTTQNIALDDKDIPISVSYINQVTATSGITVKAKSKWLNALHIRGSITDIRGLENFAFVDRVQFANPALNGEGRAMRQTNSVGVKDLEVQVNYGYGTSGNQIRMLKGNLLHQQDFTGNGKIIAVMDAGFPNVNTAQPFQRLLVNNKILGGYDFVTRNADFYSGGTHGTQVLSTMGGYVENQLVGTAPDASYYLFITEDILDENPVEESYWVEAAEMADSLGVDIINTSLSYFGYNNPDYSYAYFNMNGTTTFISRGAEIAYSRGMICVASAGNTGAGPEPHIGAPADAENVLAVGAVTSTKLYASFSSIGPSADFRVKPDVMAQGEAAVVSNQLGNVVFANGTSFSSPIIAGMVACLWQAFPNKTNTEIMQLIKQSAHLYNTPNDQFGYGIPDFNLALTNALEVPIFSSKTFTIYPNPVTSIVNLAFPKEYEKAQVSIYNNLGQEILYTEIQNSRPSFSVENLVAGIYFYKIKAGNNYQTGKLAIK